MSTEIIVNGANLSTALGVTIIEAPDRRSSPPAEWPTESVSGRALLLKISSRVNFLERLMSFVFEIKGTTQANMYDRRDEFVSRLAGDDSAGEVTVAFTDRPGVYYRRALFHEITAEAVELPLSRYRAVCVMKLREPFLVDDVEGSVAAIGSTFIDLPIANAPVWGRLRITGAFTDPTIEIRDHDGATIRRSTTLSNDGVGFSKAGGEWVELDFDLGTIVDDLAVDQLDQLDTGDPFPFPLEPEWALYRPHSGGGDNMQIRVTSGTGEYFYRQAIR